MGQITPHATYSTKTAALVALLLAVAILTPAQAQNDKAAEAIGALDNAFNHMTDAESAIEDDKVKRARKAYHKATSNMKHAFTLFHEIGHTKEDEKALSILEECIDHLDEADASFDSEHDDDGKRHFAQALELFHKGMKMLDAES